ncbi:hypothetical protein O0L34_g7359 [Tuta absoluta]|nr:hypothetical protein O0L34_g7359 [Tuta absoluta]
MTNLVFFTNRPRRSRRSSLERASGASQSFDQLPRSNSTSQNTSPEKSLYSLPERLSESSDNLDAGEMDKSSRRCRSCEGILEDEQTHKESLPTPLEAATQTKRKKNFMDRCVNKVRLC